MSSISALNVAHNIFTLNVNLNLIQNPKQNDNKKHGCCDRSTWKSSTVRQYLLLFLKILHSVSDKTIHEIHEVIEDQNEMFYLISILEFCLIYIQGVVYPTKHFLLQLMIFFFCFYKHRRLIFACFLCRSSDDLQLPHFQYNAI